MHARPASLEERAEPQQILVEVVTRIAPEQRREGVADDESYCSTLQRDMGAKYRIEFLNLGVPGDQSENMLWRLKKYEPLLRPDLVFYGVCLNDFLPSDGVDYDNNMAWKVPVPFKQHFIKKTRIGELLARKYNDVLMAAGIRGRAAAVAALGALLVYGQIVAAGPSVGRALTMAALYFAARAFDQRTPPWQAIAGAAAVMVVVNPLDVRDPGFILTFGATAALVESVRRTAPPGTARGSWRGPKTSRR